MTIKIKTKYGDMWMNVLRRFEKEHANMEFERGFLDYIENEYYQVFIDVGAAWGYFSIPASHYCELVFANEPQDSRRATLERNIRELKINNIHVSHLAVGTGELSLYVNEGERGMVGPKGGNRAKKASVEWVTLHRIADSFIKSGAKVLIKIDVEGYELDVVKSLLDYYEDPPDVVFLIERHEFPNGVGYSEETLYEFMSPYVGKKLGARGHTSHYIFRLGETNE